MHLLNLLEYTMKGKIMIEIDSFVYFLIVVERSAMITIWM